MNKVLLSLGLSLLLMGCDRATRDKTPDPLPERQAPAGAATPVASINTDSPAMPKTSRTPTAAPQQEGGDTKSDLDLQATMITPTNQTVVSSVDEKATDAPINKQPVDTDRRVTNENPATPNKPNTNQAVK